MIQFNELKITSDKKYLVINCAIVDNDYYKDMYISQIKIDTQKTFISTGPSSTPIFTKTYTKPEDTTSDDTTVEEKIDLSSVALELDVDSVSDNMFFVYVIADGELADGTPCSMTNTMDLGVVFDTELVYNSGVKMLDTLEKCEVPRDFIDYVLKWEAFEISLHLGEYTKAIEYWKSFFKNNTTTSITSNCGCHG